MINNLIMLYQFGISKAEKDKEFIGCFDINLVLAPIHTN
jgi:hypothetical protein